MERTSTDSRALREFLARVRPHLPLRESGDILMELESAVLDRVDDIARDERRAPLDDDFRRAIAEIGEPESIAASYTPGRYVVAPEAFRAFTFHFGLVFIVHLILIGIATAVQRAFHVGLFAIAPVGPHGLLSVLAAGVQAGLIDLGLVTGLHAVAGSLQRRFSAATSSFAVEAAPRQAVGRLTLAILVAVLLNVFRDDVFVVVSGGRTYPLFTPWTGEVMPLITLLLVLAAAKELAYAMLGERRATVGADALHGAAAVALLLYLMRGDPLMAVPPVEGLELFREPVNAFLAQLGTLVLAATALMMGAKTLRRCIRLAQV